MLRARQVLEKKLRLICVLVETLRGLASEGPRVIRFRLLRSEENLGSFPATCSVAQGVNDHRDNAGLVSVASIPRLFAYGTWLANFPRRISALSCGQDRSSKGTGTRLLGCTGGQVAGKGVRTQRHCGPQSRGGTPAHKQSSHDSKKISHDGVLWGIYLEALPGMSSCRGLRQVPIRFWRRVFRVSLEGQGGHLV
jgi:hypothetical protein